MKKQNARLLSLLITLSVILGACGNKTNHKLGALGFDSIQANVTEHLFGDTAKPACNLVIKLAYADTATDKRMKDSINAFLLATCLGEEYTMMDPQTALKTYAESYVSLYRNDLEEIYKKEVEEAEGIDISSWYSYYQGIEGRVQFYEKELLVYRIDYNEYTGGAHGIYMTNFINLDLRTLAPIYLDELFVADYEEPLTELLWKQLMEDNKVSTREELEELGYTSTGNLEPTANFFLSREGITFYYNVYDIAPYVVGPTEIFLPYEKIEHLLGDGSNMLRNIHC